MYIGPVAVRNESHWVVAPGAKQMQEEMLALSPGLVQIFNEILVNAVDRQFDSKGKDAMSTIDITVDRRESSISIENDGGRLPVQVHPKTGLYVPTLVFGEFLSGDNFDDSRVRFIGGRNGVGAKATNVFSKRFQVEVSDPTTRLHFVQTWEDNMHVRGEPIISQLKQGDARHSVKVTFWPDMPRFGLKKLDDDHLRLFHTRAYDAAACTSDRVAVHFKGSKLQVGDFNDYARSVLGPNFAVERITDERGAVRAEVAVALSEEAGYKSLGLVNGIRCSSGTHMRLVVDQLSAGIADLVPRKRGAKLPQAAVKKCLKVVVKVLVDQPNFDSQTKSRLTSVASKLGFDFTLSQPFIQQVADLGVLEAAMRAQSVASTQAIRSAFAAEKPSMVKLEDAMLAGKGKESCTLIVTEGDSAKALAVAGVGDMIGGRRTYGIFPLRGKLLNVRTATHKQLETNEEIRNLVQIIGLKWGSTYTSMEDVKKLRYQHIMIFSDQDLDGHHIAGLVINFIHATWPSLLEVCPDFLQRFATPIVKVFSKTGRKPRPLQEFFTQTEFETWQEEQPPGWQSKMRVKYYKGLGTSTRDEAIEYFSDLPRHILNLRYSGEGDDVAVRRAFELNRSDERKAWIQGIDVRGELDYGQDSVSISDFFNLQFRYFSEYDCRRSIPLLIDGLKPSQRKAIHVIRRFKEEQKVSQITGLVSAQTAYHHGEMSLVETIVGMAQTFVGTNNVNLLEPSGEFGTRLQGRGVHAAARYINTQATELCHALLRSEDDDVLRGQLEDGKPVEPRELLPVAPLVLFNGFKGIGTGWATDGPNYHPLEVVAALERIIRGEEPGELLPWYDGFRGTTEVDESGDVWSVGRWRLYNSQGRSDAPPDTVEVSELPVGVWTESWLSFLEDTANKTKCMLSFEKFEDHNDQNVHVLIGFIPEQMQRIAKGWAANATEAVGKLLRLKKRFSPNMWLYHAEDADKEPVLTYFETPQDVMSAFYRARRPHYERRRARMVGKLEHRTAMLENRARFVRSCGDRSLDLDQLSRPLLEVEQTLEAAGFQRLDPKAHTTVGDGDDDTKRVGEASFDYLLNMNFQALTLERAEALEKDRQRAAAELEQLRATSADEMWLRDLSGFREVYKKQKDRKEQQGASDIFAGGRPNKSRRQSRAKANELVAKQAISGFARERRRLSKNFNSGSSLSDNSFGSEKATAAELKRRCKSAGLPQAGQKEELVHRLLIKTSEAWSGKEWSALTSEELRKHAVARSLSTDGLKADLVRRLVAAAGLLLPRDMTMAAMKKELKSYGLPCKGTVKREELHSRVRQARSKLP